MDLNRSFFTHISVQKDPHHDVIIGVNPSTVPVPSEARRQKEISHSLRGRMARGAAPSNEKFLSPSEARRRKKFRIHLSCVCVYPFLQGEDLSFVRNNYFLKAAKTALTIFFKICIPPFLGLKNFVLGFSNF